MNINRIWRVFFVLVLIAILASVDGRGQDYPSFGPEKQVVIQGLDFDAMEPFISPDGEHLFFNNLNDGINTKLFYATYENDTTFNFAGELTGTGQETPPFLDAVADLDSFNNFYWTSTRAYPTQLDNLFHGVYQNGNVSNIGRVRGDFNLNTPGWLIMDHGISFDGQFLYFNNARFDAANCQGPCETLLGIAQIVNDSTFTTLAESEEILQNINDSDYIYYAPCITKDGLELYYTRYLKGEITSNTEFEICVAVRVDLDGIFSVPKVLFSDKISNIIEAPTLTSDQQIMYYHKKVDGVHEIMMRYREVITGIDDAMYRIQNIIISPNPAQGETMITFDNPESLPVSMRIVSISGQIKQVIQGGRSHQIELQTDNFPDGIYIVQIFSNQELVAAEKLVIK